MQAVQDLLPSRVCICKLLLQIIMLLLQHCQMTVQTPHTPDVTRTAAAQLPALTSDQLPDSASLTNPLCS